MFAVQAIFWWYLFAQNTWNIQCNENPKICSTPAQEFTYYVDFTEEILQIISTVNWDWEKLGWYNYIWWLFTNKLLSVPEENKGALQKMVAWMEESMSRWISTVLGVTNILWSLALTSYKDLIWFSILFQAKPIVRDRKTLLDLEMEINDKIYELSLSAMANEKLIDSSKFQKIIDKYIDDKPLFLQWSVTEDTKYKDITNMLTRLNGAMKTFISINQINQFDEFSKWWEGGIYLKFNAQTITSMQSGYVCGRWFSKCTSAWKDFKKNLKEIFPSFSKWGSDAVKVIKDANKKLAESLKWLWQVKLLEKSAWEKYLTDTEIELLKDVYGIDTKKLTKQEGLSFRDILSKANKETFNSIKQKVQSSYNGIMDDWSQASSKIKTIGQDTKDFMDTQKLLSDNKKKLKWEIIKDLSNKNIIVDQNLVNSFKDVIMIINKQQQKDLEMLRSTSSVDYLASYTQIGYIIRDVMDVVMNNDSNVVKNLGNTCEAQCTNKWIDGCYAN